MWSKVKAVLKKPVVLGLTVGALIIIGLILFRRRSAPAAVIAAGKAALDKADQVIPAI